MHFKLKQYFKVSIIIIGLFIVIPPGKVVKAQVADSLMKRIEDFGDYLLYRNHDTTFISNYGNEVAVKLITVNKYNYFRIRDRMNKSRLRYRPVRDLSMGLGISYKWFALDLTLSLGLRKNSDFQNTRSFDFQGRLFSSKQYITATIQYYRGYKLGNVSGSDVEIKSASERRDDIRTINFGLQYMFAINYTKFSLKAPFVFNEVQRKSAGSAIIGASFSMFVMDADSSIIPPEVSGDFNSGLHMRNLNIMSLGISVGYMYSFVYKDHYFLTIGLIPGLNLNFGDSFTHSRNNIEPNIHIKINTMNAIGYNGRKFFGGFNYLGDAVFSHLGKKQSAEVGHGKFSIFIGYRFGS